MVQTAFYPMGHKRNPFIGKTCFGVSKLRCPCQFDIGTLKMPSEPAIWGIQTAFFLIFIQSGGQYGFQDFVDFTHVGFTCEAGFQQPHDFPHIRHT